MPLPLKPLQEIEIIVSKPRIVKYFLYIWKFDDLDEVGVASH